MARLVITQNSTLDGVVEMLGDWFLPQPEGDVTDQLEVLRGHMAAQTVLLVGRRTFEDMRSFWPQQTDDTTGVTGSITLCHTLIGAGLVDEYRLFVFPRVLGRGRRLFPEGTDVRLAATGSRTFRSGVTLLTYRPG